uniref:Ras-GEF domain-containing protein n=1 Tax=Hydatigena taeniaeformis TaxID=6205 RepID=A0A0R3WUV1_HYDTA
LSASEVRSHRTWVQLEAAGVTLHSAESMRSRFMHSIIHHLGEVLHSTSEGRRKYGHVSFVNGLYQAFVAESNGLRAATVSSCEEESSNILSDPSYFTSDNSVHDGDQNDLSLGSLPRPSLQEQSKLIDCGDTQSQKDEADQCNASAEMCSSFNSLQKTLTERSPSGRLTRRLSLSLNNVLPRVRYPRSRCIFSRSQSASTRTLRSLVNKAHEAISGDTPDATTNGHSVQPLSRPLTTKKKSGFNSRDSGPESLTLLNVNSKVRHKAALERPCLAKSFRQLAPKLTKKSSILLSSTASSQQESMGMQLDSTFAKPVRYVRSAGESPSTSIDNQPTTSLDDGFKRRSKSLCCKNFEMVDLDSLHSSAKVHNLYPSKLSSEGSASIEVIPDTLSAISSNHSAHTNDIQTHSDAPCSSLLHNPDRLNNTSPKVSDVAFLKYFTSYAITTEIHFLLVILKQLLAEFPLIARLSIITHFRVSHQPEKWS